MIKRLNDYDDQRYHRPNDNWIEVPVQSDTSNGNPQTLTVRRRSLRAKRRIFTISCTAFTVGILMILLASPSRNEWMAPGQLSSNHANLLAGRGADRCAACHGAADASAASWISNAILGHGHTGQTQSQLCLKCHEQSLKTETALNPHNVSPEDLVKISAKYRTDPSDRGMIFGPPIADHNIACSACHREHHGSTTDLTMLTDQQCQTCHQSTIDRFETDHPEFSQYPLKRRSRIAFDHSTHSQQHFPSRASEFNCKQCHIDDDFQNVKKLASYQQACATCHEQQVLESGREGLALLSLPMLDTDAIEAAELNIGGWPLAATGDFDGPLPPIMRVLLTADPQAAGILDALGPAFDFADIDPENPDNVRDAVNLVWAIKRLLHDLAVDGPQTVRTRLQDVLRLEISNDELNRIINNLDEQVFQNAVRRWLPKLGDELAGLPIDDSEVAQQPTILNNLKIQRTHQSWWPTNETLLMRGGQGNRRLADEPTTIQGRASNLTNEQDLLAIVRVPNASKQSDQQEPATTESAAPSRVRLKNAHANPRSDPELLAINPLKLLAAVHPDGVDDNIPEVKTPPPQQIEIAETDTGDNVTQESAIAIPRSATPELVRLPETKFIPIKRPSVVVPSGWFRDDTLFRISYRPSGHADRCIQSWIDLVTRAADADSRPETKQLFDKTISLTAVGLCRTCHTADQLPDRSFIVNWRAEYRDPSVRSFTRFVHGPHMIQPQLQDCTACHKLNPASSNHASFQSVDATDAVSNFVAMKKSTCASCHSSGQTNSGCTQCHNYHVGSKVIGAK